MSSLLADARILFQRRTLPDGDWDTYTMTPDGHDLTNVTADPNAGDAEGRDDVDVRALMRRVGPLGPNRRFKWWAVQGLNLRPLACEASALPLS